MEDLIQYIKNGDLDNKQLLVFFEKYGRKSMAQTMQRSERIANRMIRYETWKLLPQEEQEKYTQDLELIADVQKSDIPEDGDEKTDIPEEDDENTDTSEKNDETTKAVSDEVKSFAIEQKAELSRKRAVLSNSLASFEIDDNEGRKKVVEQIEVIDSRMNDLSKIINGEAPVAEKIEREFEWLLNDAEVAKMNKAEIRNYKTSLTNRRGKASSAHKKGEKVVENQRIMDIIDQARLKLG